MTTEERTRAGWSNLPRCMATDRVKRLRRGRVEVNVSLHADGEYRVSVTPTPASTTRWLLTGRGPSENAAVAAVIAGANALLLADQGGSDGL